MDKREWMLQAALNALSGGFGPIDTDDLSALYDAILAATPEPSDEGWIEHRGEKPYPEDSARVTVKLRNGNEYSGVASMFVWDHLGEDDDVLAWRPARA